MPAAEHTSIGRIARLAENDSEDAFHRLARDVGLALPVQLCHLTLSFDSVPVLLPSAWLKFFLAHNLFFSLSGLTEPDRQRSGDQWSRFWKNYKALFPSHDVFQKSPEQLRRTCALVMHGDEGRSKKKLPLMILSCRSVLGKGSHVTSRGLHTTEEFLKQELNMLGHTWATRFLLATMPRALYDDEKTCQLEELLTHIVADLRTLFRDGVTCPVTGETYYMVVINIIGVWPFLAKAFNWSRTFGNSAKAETSKKAPAGICHCCLADRPSYPFEDFESPEPRWRQTLNQVPPYPQPPALMMLPHDPTDDSGFAGQDLFHGWQLGAGKVFVSSALALLSYEFPGRSFSARFGAMEASFFAFCTAQRENPYIRKLTQDTLGWPHSTEAPSGGWHKGSTTLTLTRFFIAACEERRASIGDGTLLYNCWMAAIEINAFVSMLHREKLWIPSARALFIANRGFLFLKYYGQLAYQAFKEGRPMFTFMPNLHRCHHLMFCMKDMALRGPLVLNILTWSCAMEEDFIGRPARLSRRTHARTLMLRVMERALEACYAKYVESGLIIPDGQLRSRRTRPQPAASGKRAHISSVKHNQQSPTPKSTQ